MVIWHKVGGFLIVGYLCLGRSFAYLGVPSLRIFIGEIVLAAFLLLKPRVAIGTWLASLLRPSPLNTLAFAMLVFVMYGVWQVGRGVMSGSSVFATLKHFVFNYYALYLFFGLWIGIRAPSFLPRIATILAWSNGVYGLLHIVALKSVAMTVPGTDMRLLGEPAGSAVAILGLLCVAPNLTRVWIPLTLNLVVILVTQVRAEWLALAVGMLAWGIITGRLGKVFAVGLAGLMVLGLVELADVKIAGRAGTVSLAGTIGRILAPLDKDLARRFSPKKADQAAGTVEWRQKWWEQIWRSAQSTPMLQAFGHGYGFDLFSLAPEDVRGGQAEDIRTPHSVFYYALGYTGWMGVTFFALFQATIFAALWRSYRAAGQCVGLVWWLAGMSMAFFGNYFETPFGAIPFYLLVGAGIAPGLQLAGVRNADASRPQLLSVAGR
jgi:O-Antigen ligase